MKRTWLCLILTACLAMEGCTTGISALDKKAAATLPPAAVSYAAPTGDVNQKTVENILIYVPNNAGTRLIAVSQKVQVQASRHPAEEALKTLFSFNGSDEASKLGGDTVLQLSGKNPVEISGDTACVNLSASALTLTHEQLYVVCQAITNTLAQWGDIRYVNVLVGSMQPGLDVGATVPAGCFTPSGDTIDELITSAKAMAASQYARFSMTAAIYYPAAAGKGVLAEARTVSFEDRSKEGMIRALLTVLSQGPQNLEAAAASSDLIRYLESVTVEDIAVSGGQRAVLRFAQGFNEAILNAGIPRSVMMASLALTVLSFVPGLNGITVYAGNELITSVIPGATYQGTGERIDFENGVIRRNDLSSFILSTCRLYLAGENGKLTAVTRPVPYYETRSARYLTDCLMQGSQSQDSIQAGAVFPDGMGDQDLLGVAIEEGVLLLNFSSRLIDLCSGYTAEKEKQLIYSIVNTLTELDSVRSVCIFVDGKQPETLAGSISLPGVFMRNGSIVRD